LFEIVGCASLSWRGKMHHLFVEFDLVETIYLSIMMDH
jgi:hypothetical protein